MQKKLFLYLVIACSARAQTKSIADIDFQATDTLKSAYTAKTEQPYLFIASGFGKEQVNAGMTLDSISDFLIKEIVLVYSKYYKAQGFNQAKLNDSRWSNLLKDYPSLFGNGSTNYRNVCQDISGSDSLAKTLTHGFYIYFENRADSAKREKEIVEITRMVMALGIDTSAAEDSEVSVPDTGELIPSDPKKRYSKFKKPMRAIDPKACRQPFYKSGLKDLDLFFKENIQLTAWQKRHPKELNTEVRLRLDYNGFIKSAYVLTVNNALIEQIKKALTVMSVWNPAVMNGITIQTDVKINLEYKSDGTMGLRGGLIVHHNLAKCGTKPDEELFDFSKKEEKRPMPTVFEVPDNSLLRDVVARNPKLDSLMLVVDLTGSMGPYIAQVLDLMATLVTKNEPHVSCITLFNDGNDKKDRNKQAGSTGGIIVLNEDITLDRLGKSILKSMKQGTGGDCMENNIEAVLKGVKECRACKDILMIADNYATPRDGSLVGSIAKPIHWLLCGVNPDINVHYLDLVRANKGMLHTLRTDVSNLHLLQENETVIIDGNGYKLIRGKFKLL